jgi:hypothetical protein
LASLITFLSFDLKPVVVRVIGPVAVVIAAARILWAKGFASKEAALLVYEENL